MIGYITVTGNVYGSIATMSGDNEVNGSVYGSVSTMSGDNEIGGDAPGSVSTISGKNRIAGNPGHNKTGKNKSSSTYSNVRIFNSNQQMSSEDQQYVNDVLSSVFSGGKFKF